MNLKDSNRRFINYEIKVIKKIVKGKKTI